MKLLLILTVFATINTHVSASGEAASGGGVYHTNAIELLTRDNPYSRVEIRRALDAFPEDERNELALLALRLLTPDRSNTLSVLEVFKRYRLDELERLVALITADRTKLLTDDNSNAVAILSKLSSIRGDTRTLVIEFLTDPRTRMVHPDRSNASALLRDMIVISMGRDLASILRRARENIGLPPSHPAFEDRMTELFSRPLWERVRPIDSPEVQEEIRLKEIVEPLLDASRKDRKKMVEVISKEVPASERSDFVRLITDGDGHCGLLRPDRTNAYQIVFPLAYIKPRFRRHTLETICTHRDTLVSRNLNNLGYLIGLLGLYSESEQREFIEFIAEDYPLIDDERENVVPLLEQIRQIPERHRHRFVRLLKESGFINRSRSNAYMLIWYLKSLPIENVENLIQNIRRYGLLKEDASNAEGLVDRLRFVKPAERAARIEFALRRIDVDKSHPEYTRKLLELIEAPAEEIMRSLPRAP